MKSIFAKGRNNSVQKITKFIAPGNLARKYGQKAFKLHEDQNTHKNTCKNQRLRDEGQRSGNNCHNRIGGVSVHTLTMHFGEVEWKESNFTEDLKRRMDIFESTLSQIENENRAPTDVSSSANDFVNDDNQV